MLSDQPMKLKTTKKRTKQQKEKSPNAFSGVTDLNSETEVSWSLNETKIMDLKKSWVTHKIGAIIMHRMHNMMHRMHNVTDGIHNIVSGNTSESEKGYVTKKTWEKGVEGESSHENDIAKLSESSNNGITQKPIHHLSRNNLIFRWWRTSVEL